MYVRHLYTHLCRWRLHRVVVEEDVLQLPEFPVGRRDLCDLIAGKVKSDERQVGQLCTGGREGEKMFKERNISFQKNSVIHICNKH